VLQERRAFVASLHTTLANPVDAFGVPMYNASSFCSANDDDELSIQVYPFLLTLSLPPHSIPSSSRYPFLLTLQGKCSCTFGEISGKVCTSICI
jgi:hypothetical protein